MANAPTLESLEHQLARQDEELEELMARLRHVDPRDVPASFFDDLDAACEPPVAQPTITSFTPFGLRA